MQLNLLFYFLQLGSIFAVYSTTVINMWSLIFFKLAEMIVVITNPISGLQDYAKYGTY